MRNKWLLLSTIACIAFTSTTVSAQVREYNDDIFSLVYDSDLFTVSTSDTGTVSVSAINMPSNNGGHNTVLGCMSEINTDYNNMDNLSEADLLDFGKTFTSGLCTGLFDVDSGISIITDGYSYNRDSCEYFMILSDGTECYVTMHNYGKTVYYTVCRLCPYSAELNDGFRSIYRSIHLSSTDSNESIPALQTEAIETYEAEYIALSDLYEVLQSEYDILLAEKESLQIDYDALLAESKTTTDFSTETQISSEQLPDVEGVLQQKLSGIEKNTNAALDKIIEIAKNDSASVSEAQINNAIAAIRNNYPQYYNGPECMELYLYYGYLLDYTFDDSDPRSELGMDTYQAIKYVYRNVETVLDSSTKANLDQIEKDLQYIP